MRVKYKEESFRLYDMSTGGQLTLRVRDDHNLMTFVTHKHNLWALKEHHKRVSSHHKECVTMHLIYDPILSVFRVRKQILEILIEIQVHYNA